MVFLSSVAFSVLRDEAVVSMASYVLTIALLVITAAARDIVFPPVAGFDAYQTPLGSGEDVDIIFGSAFSGLTTFANLPYISCFDDKSETERYDIAMLGAPFDTVSIAFALIHCFPFDSASLYSSRVYALRNLLVVPVS